MPAPQPTLAQEQPVLPLPQSDAVLFPPNLLRLFPEDHVFVVRHHDRVIQSAENLHGSDVSEFIRVDSR